MTASIAWTGRAGGVLPPRAPALRFSAMASEAREAGGSDAADVRGAVSGEPEAFARIVRRHQGEVARRMWRFTRDPAAHEDLVQEAFVEAYRSLPRFCGTGPFAAWLDRIAVRTGYASWRRQARGRLRFLGGAADLPDRAVGGAGDDPDPSGPSEAAERVHRLLARLSPRDRLVLTLLHLEERTVGEVAGLTGWSASLVKVQAWRARRRLAALVEQEGLR